MYSLLTLFAATCGKHTFFGLVPWYQYLPLREVTDKYSGHKYCQIVSFNLLPGGGNASDVPLILLAIIDDLLRLAGILAIGYIIYGGIQYTTSQGEPDRTAKAQGTIVNALAGLAITIVAISFVSFVGRRLGG